MTLPSTTRLLALCLVVALVGLGACQETDDFDNDGFADNTENAESDDDNDDNVGINDDPQECDPVAACHDYCYEKYARCLDENCLGDDPLQSWGATEQEICMQGLNTEDDEGNPEPFIDGCIDEAAESEEACEAFRHDAEYFADQSCDSDEQRYRQCNELDVFLTTLADDVYDDCGCTPAATGQSCVEDDECDEYGDGLCLAGDDESVCTAECNDFSGHPPSSVLPDPSCAEDNGLCLHLNETYVDGTDGVSSMCNRSCTELEDCPEGSSCAPVFELEDDEALGLCTRGVVWDLNFELCLESDDCPAGTDCREGTCQPACGEDGVACDLGDCGDDGYCEVDFVEVF